MPISSNVALTDTFDQQRLKINQTILLVNDQEDRSNLIFTTTNTVFEQSNTDNVRLSAAYVVLNAAFTQSNTDNVRLSGAYLSLNTAFEVLNVAFEQANTDNVRLSAAYVVLNAAFTQSNTDNIRLTSTFSLANATSNNLANTAVAANNYSGFMANSVNSYATQMTASSNNYGGAMANSSNNYAGAMANSSNNFAGFMVNGVSLIANAGYVQANTARNKANDAYGLAQTLGGDTANTVIYLQDNWYAQNNAFDVTNAAYTQSNTDNIRLSAAYVVVNSAYGYANTTANNLANTATAANNYAGAMANSGNNYAGVMANSANAYATATYATQTTVATNATSANNYAGVMANSANAYATATFLAKAGGTITSDLVIGGNLTVSGSTTYVNTANLMIGDNILVLNADVPNTFTATENAGIEINRGNKGNATILWIETAQGWAFSDNTRNAITTYITSNTYADGIAANAAAAFLKANNVATGANGYASTVGLSTNAYSATVGTSANAYASAVGVSANAYALSTATTIGTSGNAYALSTATSIGTSGNSYAQQVGAAANAYTSATYAPKASPSISSPTFTGTVTFNANMLSQILTDAATVNWNAALGSIATVTLAGDRVMGAPSNLRVGTYILHVIQDGAGGRTLDFASAGVYKWVAGVTPELTSTPGARDVISFVSDGTYLYGSWLPDVK
jgi:hypothetical protein